MKWWMVCLSAYLKLSTRYSHNIYVMGHLFSRPWARRDWIARAEFFRPRRGPRNSLMVVVLYLPTKFSRGPFSENRFSPTQRFFIIASIHLLCHPHIHYTRFLHGKNEYRWFLHKYLWFLHGRSKYTWHLHKYACWFLHGRKTYPWFMHKYPWLLHQKSKYRWFLHKYQWFMHEKNINDSCTDIRRPSPSGRTC